MPLLIQYFDYLKNICREILVLVNIRTNCCGAYRRGISVSVELAPMRLLFTLAESLPASSGFQTRSARDFVSMILSTSGICIPFYLALYLCFCPIETGSCKCSRMEQHVRSPAAIIYPRWSMWHTSPSYQSRASETMVQIISALQSQGYPRKSGHAKARPPGCTSSCCLISGSRSSRPYHRIVRCGDNLLHPGSGTIFHHCSLQP